METRVNTDVPTASLHIERDERTPTPRPPRVAIDESNGSMQRKRSKKTAHIVPMVAINELQIDGDATRMVVDDGPLDLTTETESTQTQLPCSSGHNFEMRGLQEIQEFIATDLLRYTRLPKGGCKEYITKKATEDAFTTMKERGRLLSITELHHILNDHVTRAVANERSRRYTKET